MNDKAYYAAFVSYARADEEIAAWLARYLEGLWVAAPKLQRPFRRVFRDADELGASPSLGDTLRLRLDQSERLIILLSEASLKSKWVAEEIAYFREHHPDRPIFALVIDQRGLQGRSVTAWVKEALGQHADDHPLLRGPEPAAPDVTTEGRKVAARRLAAGMLDLSYDTLAQRRVRASAMIGGAIALLLCVVGVGAYFGQPALASYQAIQVQRAAEADFVASLDEVSDGVSAARILGCCNALLDRAPEASRNRIYELVRASGLFRGPLPSRLPSQFGYTSFRRLGPNRLLATGGDGFVVVGPTNFTRSFRAGNVMGTGWDPQTDRIFTVSSGLNFRGASIRAYSLSQGARASGSQVTPQGSFDVTAEGVRALTVEGTYAYFVDTNDWRVARIDMRDGTTRTGRAGRPTRADASPDGRIVRFGSGNPNENLLADMGNMRSAPDIHGTMMNFGVVAPDSNRVFRFDTWTWSNVVDKGEATIDGFEGLVPFNGVTIGQNAVGVSGVYQVRCVTSNLECERTIVFSTPNNLENNAGYLSTDQRIFIQHGRAFDIQTRSQIYTEGAGHFVSWRDGREVLGITGRGEFLSWDLQPSLDFTGAAASRRICETTLNAVQTIGNRTFGCQR